MLVWWGVEVRRLPAWNKEMALRTQTRERFRNKRAGICLCRVEVGVREGPLTGNAGGTI